MNDNNTPVVKPWGTYLVLLDEPTYKVKIITVFAGQRISLQRHQKRAEQWTCVSGRLGVFRCSVLQIVPSLKNPICTTIVDPGQSVWIPQGTVHRASAPKNEDVTFIEIQTGTYFGEDDIIRYEDDYNRI